MQNSQLIKKRLENEILPKFTRTKSYQSHTHRRKGLLLMLHLKVGQSFLFKESTEKM